MDTSTFDALTRFVSRRHSRRTTLAALAAGAVAIAGPAPNLAAKKKHKKKKFELCFNGQTITVPKKQRNGYIRQGATAGKCAAGFAGCTSDAGCNACLRETCQSGVCACPAGLGRDANGVCGEALSCKGAGTTVASAGDCCSGSASPTKVCQPGNQRCLSSAGCTDGAKCLGGMCPGPYLATVGKQCAPTVGCPSPESCGSDANGACSCASTGVCASSTAQVELIVPGSTCLECPSGTARCTSSGARLVCYPACGQRFACCGKAGDECGFGVCNY